MKKGKISVKAAVPKGRTKLNMKDKKGKKSAKSSK